MIWVEKQLIINCKQQMNNSQPTMTMQEFYQKVIDDFKKKLFDKFNQKQKDFDSQMIDQIANRVKTKMQRPQLLFAKALEIKHRSLAGRDMLIKQTIPENNEVKKQQVQPDHIDAEDDVDYAEVFNRKETEVKKEEGDQNGIIKHQPNQEQDDEKDEEDQRQKLQTIERVKNGLATHIVGTYERQSKKHVAKDQSTKLLLENVFIKCKNKGSEIFIPRLACEFRKQ